MSRDEIFKLLLSRATRLGAGSDREEEEQEEVEQEEVVEDSVEREGRAEAREGLAERAEAVGDSLRFWMIFSSMREMTLLLTLWVEREASDL